MAQYTSNCADLLRNVWHRLAIGWILANNSWANNIGNPANHLTRFKELAMDYQAAAERLNALKDEYQSRIDKIEHDIRHPADDMIQDWEDQAVVAEQNDMRKNLLVEAQDNLELVNQALRRLENDQYGVCVVCGEDIEDGRLEAVPFATTCMQHAQ